MAATSSGGTIIGGADDFDRKRLARRSATTSTFGGALIDADLARPRGELDPRATGDSARRPRRALPLPFSSRRSSRGFRSSVIDDGSTGNPARIRVTGKPSEFLTQTKTVDELAVGEGLAFILDYALGPNDDYLTITASMTYHLNQSPV